MSKRLGVMLSLAVGMIIAAVMAVPPTVHAEDAIVKLVSAQNGKCLQPINASHNQGDAIVQQPCNGSAAQQWTVHLVSGTKVHLINRASGLCLDARGKAANGTPIQQWTCNTITNENWSFGITNNSVVFRDIEYIQPLHCNTWESESDWRWSCGLAVAMLRRSGTGRMDNSDQGPRQWTNSVTNLFEEPDSGRA